MEDKKLREIEDKIKRAKEEKELADKERELKLKEFHSRISSKLSRMEADHPFLTLPAVEASKRLPHFSFPHFSISNETKRKFRMVAKRLREHMERVMSNKAFAEHLTEGETKLNPVTHDLITKTDGGYIATKKIKVKI